MQIKANIVVIILSLIISDLVFVKIFSFYIKLIFINFNIKREYNHITLFIK